MATKITMLRNPSSAYGCSLKEGETGVVDDALARTLAERNIAVVIEAPQVPKAIKAVPEPPAIAAVVAKPAQESVTPDPVVESAPESVPEQSRKRR